MNQERFLIIVAIVLSTLLVQRSMAQDTGTLLKSKPVAEEVKRIDESLGIASEQGLDAVQVDTRIREVITQGLQNNAEDSLPDIHVVKPQGQMPRKVGNKWIATYGLSFGDFPLSEASNVSSVVLEDGSKSIIRERNTPIGFEFEVEGGQPPEPNVTIEVAMGSALNELAELADQRGLTVDIDNLDIENEPQLEVWVDPESRLGRLSWALDLVSDHAAQNAPQAFRVWIDALSGDSQPEVFEIKELVVQEHSGRVTATVWYPTPLHPEQNYPLGNAQVTRAPLVSETESQIGEGADSVETNSEGRFSFENGINPSEFTVNLKNRNFEVENASGDVTTATADGDISAPVELKFASEVEFDIAQPSAFYWANQARSFVIDILDDAELLDVKLRVNAVGECNAFWSSASNRITLFRASTENSTNSCVNRAYRDTIFHEFGHAVDHAMGGIPNTLDGRALSEGQSDALAILFKAESCYGSNCCGLDTCLRSAEVPEIHFPATNSGIHQRGRIFSGFVWELIQSLKASMPASEAIDLAKQLVLQTIAQNPAGIENAITMLIDADDDDLDLSNGTPHSAAIIAAASSRSIPLPDELPIE